MSRLVDLHCHLLPGVDDGAKDLRSTLAMLKNAEQAGVTDLVFTPHYVTGSRYCFNNEAKTQILEIVKKAAALAGLKVNLYLGNEVFIDPRLPDLLNRGEIATLNGGRYLLVELPVQAEDQSAKQTLFELVCAGYTPIIAHPERYLYFQSHPRKIHEYAKLGCLMQGDYRSLTGRYGRHAKKTLKIFLKNGEIDLLASDTHKPTDDYRLDKIYTLLAKLLKSSTAAEELLVNTPRKIIQSAPLQPPLSAHPSASPSSRSKS